MTNEKKVKIETTITLTASLVTILQFAFSISPVFGVNIVSLTRLTDLMNLPSRLLIFMLAEVILAWGFSSLIKNVRKFVSYSEPFGWMLLTFIIFPSAWVTVFNSQVILVASYIDYSIDEYALFTLGVIVSAGLSIAMIYQHLKIINHKEKYGVSISQGIAFLMMFSTVQNAWKVVLGIVVLILSLAAAFKLLLELEAVKNERS